MIETPCWVVTLKWSPQILCRFTSRFGILLACLYATCGAQSISAQPSLQELTSCIDPPQTETILISDFLLPGSSQISTARIISTAKIATSIFDPSNLSIEISAQRYSVKKDTVVLEICDDNGLCAETSLFLDFIPDNLLHTSCDFNFTFVNQTVSGDLLYNDAISTQEELEVSTSFLIPPKHGKVVININGEYIYTPNKDFMGEDQFSYLACTKGSPRFCEKNVVKILVSPPIINCETAFLAVDDCFEVDYFGSTSSNLVANDPNLTIYSTTVNTFPVMQPLYGDVVIDRFGDFTYTNTAVGFGYDSFKYEICLTEGVCQKCDIATVVIRMEDALFECSDFKAVIQDDYFVKCQDQSVIGNIFSNDQIPTGTRLNARVDPNFLPAVGTVNSRPDGYISYTPPTGFNGRINFRMIVCDPNTSICDHSSVIMEIKEKYKPELVDDQFEITSSGCRVLPVFNNDQLLDGFDNSSFMIMSGGGSGTFTAGPNGLEYCPNGSSFDPDTIMYVLQSIASPCQEDRLDTAKLILNFMPFLSLEHQFNLTYASKNGVNLLTWEVPAKDVLNTLGLEIRTKVGQAEYIDLLTSTVSFDMSSLLDEPVFVRVVGETSTAQLSSKWLYIDNINLEEIYFYYDGNQISNNLNLDIPYEIISLRGDVIINTKRNNQLRPGLYLIRYRNKDLLETQKLIVH